MMRAAVAARSAAPLWLLFGVRHEADVLWRAELEALAAAEPFVRFVITLSRPGEGWSGRRGYVQDHVEGLWTELDALGAGSSGTARPHVYVCGLEKMVGSVRELLRKKMGLERKQVHSERYD
jgi:NAD(P)H-flavin reductase